LWIFDFGFLIAARALSTIHAPQSRIHFRNDRTLDQLAVARCTQRLRRGGQALVQLQPLLDERRQAVVADDRS